MSEPPQWPSSPQDPGQQPPGWGQAPPPGPPYGAPPGGRPPYSAPSAIGYGWRKFTQNLGPFLLLGLIAVGSALVISFLGSVFSGGGDLMADRSDDGMSFALAGGFGFVGILFNLLGQVVATFFQAALIRGAFDSVEGRPVTIGGMFERWDKIQVLVTALLVSIMVSIGVVLCILPGIVLMFFTFLAMYFVVDQGQDAITAIKSSFRFTADNAGNLLLLALLAFLVLLLGAIACLVGLFVAFPVITIAAAYTFRVLQGQPAAP